MIYQKVIGGHRNGYALTIESMTGLTVYRKIGVVQDLKAMISAKVFFDLSIEDGVMSFFFISLLRALLRKKTIGIMLSPWDCYRPNVLKDKFRRYTFILLKKLTHVRVICMIPFDMDERYKNIADCWIYDPEFWDMHVFEERRFIVQNSSRSVKSTPTGKLNLLYLGGVNPEKGFDFLAKLFLENKNLFIKFDLSVVGKISKPYMHIANQLREAGADVVDEFVSDERMFDFIKQSSLMWCCYCPRYDASSGIFGRAIQFDKLPLIRKSSRLEKLAGLLGKHAVMFEFGNVDEALLQLNEIDIKGSSSNEEINTYEMYCHAKEVIKQCMV